MKFKKEFLRKIIQEELQAVLSEQKTQYNFKLLDKVMLSKNRLGRFKKCETGGGFIGLKMGCMGKDVATMQALINKWFEKNVPEAKEWQEKTGKAIIDVDGLYGKDTAQALAFIYNEKEPGPVMRRSYDVGVDRKIATIVDITITTVVPSLRSALVGQLTYDNSILTFLKNVNIFLNILFSLFKIMAGPAGLEPATPGFGDRCSTN